MKFKRIFGDAITGRPIQERSKDFWGIGVRDWEMKLCFIKITKFDLETRSKIQGKKQKTIISLEYSQN